MPSIAKRTNASSRTVAPRASPTQPNARSHPAAPLALQPVSNQGIRPATTPGARARNTAVPAAARRRLPRALCDRSKLTSVAEHAQVEPSDPLPVAEEVELDDLPVPDGRRGDREGLPVEERDNPR